MANIVYLGKDEGYWNSIKERIEKDYPVESFEFHQCYHDNLRTFQKVLIKIIKFKPDVIFLDFSKDSLKVMTVARTLRRIYPNMRGLIGLWNYLASKEMIDESNTTGVTVTHIKSGEIGEVVRQAMYLGLGKKSEGFVKAEPAENIEIDLNHKMRIGYMTNDVIHVEHDVIPPLNEKFEVKTHFFDGAFAKHFTVDKRINENLYYNFEFCSDFKIIFHPNTPPKQNESDKEAQWRIKDDEETEASRIKKLTEWIDENHKLGIPKRTKILIVDKDLSIIKQADRPLDEYPYSIRFLREIDEEGEQLKKIKAGIIVYQCPPKQEGQIRDLMAQIEQIPGYDPFVVIFQSSWKSEYLKEHFKYERIMGQKDPFDLKILLDFCRVYESNEGREKSHANSSNQEEVEKRVYISKSLPESIAEYPVKIFLNNFNESSFKFQCRETIPDRTIFFVDWPLDVCLTIVEEINEGDWKMPDHNQYLALIHCIGEKEKAEFRRKINDTIYAAKMAKEKQSEEAASETSEGTDSSDNN